jgi:hypothetical protein
MAIAYDTTVAANTYNHAAAASVVITPGGTPANGELMLISIAVAPATNVDPGAISVTGGTGGWTQISNDYVFNTANGNGFRRAIFYRVAGASEPATYTASWTNSDKFSFSFIGYTGASATPLDIAGATVHNLNNFTLVLAAAPSVTPVGATDLEICVYSYNGASGGTNTLPAALTSRLNQTQSDSVAPWIGIGDIQLSSNNPTAVQTMQSTNTASGFWIWTADSITISPPAAGGDTFGNQMNLVQMKRKSIGWSPLFDHRRRVLRPNRALFVQPKLFLPKNFKKAA